MVVAAAQEQLAVRPLLNYLAVLHHQDQVRAPYGREPVRYEKARAVLQDVLDGVLNELLRLRVDGARRLVQHEDARVRQHRPGKGHQLLLARRELVAALAHVRLPAVFQLCRNEVRRHRLRRRLDLLVRRVQPAVPYVLTQRARKQVRALQHVADARVQPQLAPLPVVHAVYQYLPGRRLEKAAGQVHKRRFPRARLAHYRHRRPRRDLEVEV